MSNKLSSSGQRKDTTVRRRKLLGEIFKPRTNQGDVERDGSSSRSRSSSRLSLFRKSPDPKIKDAKNAQSTPGADAATSKIATDNNTTAQPDIKTGAKIAAADPNRDNDMWKIAEETLRQDAQKCEKLKEYDRILENYFKSKLKPVGTLERREQFLGFLNSKTEQLNDINSETQLKKCSIEARRYFKSAVSCVIATKDIIATAAAHCPPASVACAGVMFLLLVCQ